MPDRSPPNWRWSAYGFRAMNTTVQTWLYSQTEGQALTDVQRLFASFERRLSRFDPDSELSKLNAGQHEVFQASPTLIDVVEAALWAAQATHGLYDPTILKALERAGYDRSFEQIEPVQAMTSAVPLYGPKQANTDIKFAGQPTFRSVQINRAGREIYKPVGLGLDLGGIGKGWTVDRAADRLQGLGPFLINAGGDIFAYQAPPGQKGWQIDLVHPRQLDRSLATVALHHQALATSTIARRRWQRQGRMMHHLIDPRSGQPAHTDALSVSVTAERTMLAELYAKVALILGVTEGLAYLEQLPGVEGLIFTAAGEVQYTTGFESLLIRLEPDGYIAE